MKARVVKYEGEFVIEIRGTAPGAGGVIHTSGPITLDTKSEQTRMEIEWCQHHSTVSFADLYDCIRVAQREARKVRAA